MLPPGLYEARFEPKSEETANAELVSGDWVMRCEERTLDDIRALGGHEIKDERLFATVDQISKANLALYRSFMQPFVRMWATPATAEWMRKLHPLRLQYEVLNDSNPFASVLANSAEKCRRERKTVEPQNPFLKTQEAASQFITSTLKSWGKLRDNMVETMFLSIYGSPVLQAATGIDPASNRPLRKAPKTSLHQKLIQSRIAELKAHIEDGGLLECSIRGLLYAGSVRGRIDERGVNTLKNMRVSQDRPKLTLSQFKSMAREQYYMLLLDPETTLQAIPKMLPDDMKSRRDAFDSITRILAASEELTGETAECLERVQRLFGLDDKKQVSKASFEPTNKVPDAREVRPPLQTPARVSAHGRTAKDEHSLHRARETSARKI